MWWNGGNRNVPVRHNIIGVLSEMASVNVGSPIFQKKSDLRPVLRDTQYGPSNQYVAPWPGGWWLLHSEAEGARQGYSSQQMRIFGRGGALVVSGRQLVAIYA